MQITVDETKPGFTWSASDGSVTLCQRFKKWGALLSLGYLRAAIHEADPMFLVGLSLHKVQLNDGVRLFAVRLNVSLWRVQFYVGPTLILGEPGEINAPGVPEEVLERVREIVKAKREGVPPAPRSVDLAQDEGWS